MNLNITVFIINKSEKWKRPYEFALISQQIHIPTTNSLSSMIIRGTGLLDKGQKTIVQPHNKTMWMDIDKKLYILYKIMIKSVDILFEGKISMIICAINKLCGKYKNFYKFKNITWIVITFF